MALSAMRTASEFGVGDAVSLNGRHAELARRALDADGDLAAIGDQEPRDSAIHVDLDERLSGHDGLFVVDDEFDDLAGDVGVHLDERLHHLDQADHVADRDRFALRLERRLVRRGLAIESAGQGRNDLAAIERPLSVRRSA